LKPENKVHFLGEFHHSEKGLLMGLLKKKGARSFREKNKKTTKNTNGATWRMKHVLNSRSKK